MNKSQPGKEPKGKVYVKYSALAIQIIATIGGLVFLGKALDDKLQNETPWYTLVFSSLGVVGMMIYLIVRVSKP